MLCVVMKWFSADFMWIEWVEQEYETEDRRFNLRFI